MKLQESGENYLETILILHQRTGFVRSVDIANEMGFSKPSISHAMGLLKDGGYITMDPRTNQILLTPAGEEVANRIYERHCVLRDMLMALGVSEKVASADACKIEHDLSDETFACLKRHVQAMKKPTNEAK